MFTLIIHSRTPEGVSTETVHGNISRVIRLHSDEPVEKRPAGLHVIFANGNEMHFSEGHFYLMNEQGATVAKWNF